MSDSNAAVLLGLPYSPWSEKARWACDAAGLDYRFEHYQPLLGEPGLRLRSRRLRGRVSVPVLFPAGGGPAIADSAEIARYADAHGARPGRLFPAAGEATIRHLIELSEAALAAGRTLALLRQLQDPVALGELLPRGLRGLMGPLGTPVAAFGVRRTLRKYDATPPDVAGRALDAALDGLRAALGGTALRPTVLPEPSFADIAGAACLGFIAPPDSPHVRIGHRSRAAFSDPARAERAADLLAWRDALYAHHRG